MKKISLLAFALLTGAIAACSPLPPPAADGLHGVRISDPRVQLQTQGLLSASVGAASLTLIHGQRYSSSWMAEDMLALLWPIEETAPSGLVPGEFLTYVPSKEAYKVLEAEQDATHRLYRSTSLRKEDLAKLTAAIQKGGGPWLPTTLIQDANDDLWATHPDAETYTLKLSLPEGDAERLRFTHSLIDEDGLHLILSKTLTITGTRDVMAKVRAEVTLKDAKGTPLVGLTKANFVFGLTRKQGEDKIPVYPGAFTLTLRELGSGKYDFTAEHPLYGNTLPDGYVIDLAVQNAPLIHDVED